jgi:hypothetical protein
MVVFTALLLASAAEAPPRPRPVSVAASATVEVLRAERIGDRSPEALLRQYRREADGLIVEFD